MHGVPVAEARLLWFKLEGGRTIVMVQSPGRIEAAGDVLELAGATSVQTWVRGWTRAAGSIRAAATAFALRHGLA
jgi:hypothetical protein